MLRVWCRPGPLRRTRGGAGRPGPGAAASPPGTWAPAGRWPGRLRAYMNPRRPGLPPRQPPGQFELAAGRGIVHLSAARGTVAIPAARRPMITCKKSCSVCPRLATPSLHPRPDIPGSGRQMHRSAVVSGAASWPYRLFRRPAAGVARDGHPRGPRVDHHPARAGSSPASAARVLGAGGVRRSAAPNDQGTAERCPDPRSRVALQGGDGSAWHASWLGGWACCC